MPQIDASERTRRRLEDRVRRFMDDEALWLDGGRLLVAVSGGPDSSALLALLSRLTKQRPLQLTAAYFDHGLRGAVAAQAERDAVEALCRSLDVPLVCGAADVRTEAQRTKRSLEDAARRLRYAFLAAAAHDTGCSAAATGHTASDQAETVLLNLVRGAGLAGLAAMSPTAPWPFRTAGAPRLLRPLLCLSRDDTAVYCAAAGIAPVQDESNLSPAYRRNRVRNEVLPLLRGLNPRIEDALVRIADAARDDVAYLEAAAASAVEGESTRIARTAFAAMPPPLRPHVLRFALRGLSGDLEGFGARHLDALDRLVLKGRTGDRIDLPRGVVAHLTYDALVLSLGASEAVPLPECGVRLSVPGEVRCGGLIVSAGVEAPDGAVCVTLDAESVGASLTVRRRRDGDRMQPLGMTGTKKLQDLFVDARVPRDLRDAVPVFENERGIVWAGGVRVADWARARPNTPVVTLSYRPV